MVDFVELTPRLLFLTQWARGVTQTANWQHTPLSTLGLDGRGQVRASCTVACLACMYRYTSQSVSQSIDQQQTYNAPRTQIIGVADTGMDPKVCFLSDANTVPYNAVSTSHRKVVTYITFADNQVSARTQDKTPTATVQAVHRPLSWCPGYTCF